ncbi:minor tail protein [Gordonia phage Niagara]|uniref:Minor tail protein n=2 Tax=Demosthenesvirus katyusha TaxID=1982108 RepID=A0A345MCI3_9CAUD|nr:minor tail protein [Gordonia phage Teatealatte]QBP29587.1 minor tail protein [Gordonia phage Tredge]UJD20667.1 minor tail protein [Gordonia phage Niagara]
MSQRQLSEYAVTAAVRDVIKTIARNEIQKARPASRLAAVQSIDPVDRSAQVIFVGETQPVRVPYTSKAPAFTGQFVRIGGTTHDRYIEDVIGQDFTSLELEKTKESVGKLMEAAYGEGWFEADPEELGITIGEYLTSLDNQGAVDALAQTVQEVETTANNANTAANNANTTAGQAQSTADAAQQTANDANAAVGGAVTAAEQAEDKANLVEQITAQITNNINALGQGVADGVSGVAEIFETIGHIFGTASEAQERALAATTALRDLINQNEAGAAGGKSGGDNFERVDSADLGPNWVHEVTGSSYWAVNGGKAVMGFGSGSSLAHERWNGADKPVGDYHQATLVFGSGYDTFGSPLIYLYIRWDGLYTGSGTNRIPLNCWAVRIARSGELTLLRIVNGAMTEVNSIDSGPNIGSGTVVSIRCGSLADERQIIVTRDGEAIISHTDTANLSQMGPGFREMGFAGYVDDWFGIRRPPANIASFSWSDIPGGGAILGKGFRFSRTNTANLTQVANAQLPTTTFQALVYSESCKPIAGSTLNAARGEFAIPFEGWWDFEFGFYGYTVSLSSGASTVLEPVLYNGQGALSTTIPLRMSKITNAGSTAGRTQIQEVAKFRKYCLVGERVAPGWAATRLDYMTADAAGNTCYFNGVLLTP